MSTTQSNVSDVRMPDPNFVHPELVPAETAGAKAARYVAALARVSLGFTFLWAFIDKLIGLDHATPSARAWINGGSPTSGFLKGVEGPFAGLYNGLSGNAFFDWLFMLGLLGIGAALLLGIGMRIAAVAGSALLVLMWSASLPIATNPFLDDHLIYAVVLVLLALIGAGKTVGLGATWEKLPIVHKNGWLK
jgi:thiosulfate dehydrogenase [quinone] large subunit